MSESRPHHHGNLREALISAGLDILAEGGPDALSLRKCAARAGVSHAAPAHHFKGLVSLKAAIIARGHRLFADTMRAAAEAAEDDPQAQLAAICRGYIEFSRRHRALFQFMFQPHGIAPGQIDAAALEEVTRESAASYQVLREACRPFDHPGGDPLASETMVWSLVHGYALLFGDGGAPFGKDIPDITTILPRLKLRDV